MCILLLRCVCCIGRGNSSLHNKIFRSSAGKNWLVGRAKRLTKQCHFCLLISRFLVHQFRDRLAWHTIGIYHSAISAFLEPHHHHKALNNPIFCKLICHFYLQHPLDINGLIHGMLNIYFPFRQLGSGLFSY